MNISGELIALGVAFCWTFTVLSFEYAGKKVGSMSVNYIRLVIGIVLLSLFTFLIRGTLFPFDASFEAWTWLSLSGFVGLVIGDLFLFQSFVDVGGRVSMLIMTLSPPLSTLLSYLILGEMLSPIDLLGMTITISGVMFVILVKRSKGEALHPHAVRGAVFAFIGALGQALGLILSKKGMGDFNAFAATQIRLFAALIGFTIIFLIRKEFKNVKIALKNKKAMKVIAIGSFFGPFLGVSLSLLAMKTAEIGVTATIQQINVILIIPFTVILFKDKVNLWEVVGSFIAFTGVALMFL